MTANRCIPKLKSTENMLYLFAAVYQKTGADERQLPIRKHREERENGITSAVPFSHFSVDAVTFDISKTPIPL